MNYYNEWEKSTAAWLRELIKAGVVPPGDVDERSITEVQPSDLRGYTQCHFFAGILGWPLALQLAGWPADRPVWTGSCPCQPFSSAGKRKGAADERHLWPEMFRLIRECRPQSVFGEQVASAIGHGWLDGISANLEGEGYAVGAVVLGAHSVGAPHIRQRLFWVADSQSSRVTGIRGERTSEAVTASTGRRHKDGEPPELVASGNDGGVSDTERRATERHRYQVANAASSVQGETREQRFRNDVRDGVPTNFWSDFDTLPFRDGKTRRIEPSIQPLVNGLPRGMVPSCNISIAYAQATPEARAMRLNGYGNAIVPQVAAEFIGAYMDFELSSNI